VGLKKVITEESFMGYSKRVIQEKPRVLFDPNNKKHLVDYASFLKYNNWKNGCQYLLEDPYMDIPTMINEKVVSHFLTKYMEKV
jgi:hypothetical protein